MIAHVRILFCFYDNSISFYIQFRCKNVSLRYIHLVIVDLNMFFSFNDCSLENFSYVALRMFTYVRIMYELNRKTSSKQNMIYHYSRNFISGMHTYTFMLVSIFASISTLVFYLYIQPNKCDGQIDIVTISTKLYSQNC